MSGFESVLSHPFIHALGWALLHFIWQGAAVTILLAGGLFLLRGHAASLRYGVALSTMLLMPLLLGITTFLIWNSSHANIAEQNDVPRSRIKKGTQIDFMREVVVDESMALSKLKKLTRAQEKSTIPSKNFASTEPLAVRWRSWVSDRLEWVLSIWLVGVLVLSLRLMVGWTQAQCIKRKGTSPVPAHWQERMTGICEKLGLRQSVRLLESALVKVPTVIGWLRSVILLPASALTGLTPGQLEALIAHELAHIRRYDYLFNLLQTVVETLLFYHPAVWWMAKRVRIEREHCCDDFAVAVCGDALTYANALTEMEQLRNVSPQLAMAANGGSLLERVRRLIDAPAVTASTSARRLAGVVVVVTIVVMRGIAYLSSGAMAVPAKTDDTTTPSTQVTSHDKQKLLGELMRALSHESESVREKLVEILEEIGEPAVPALIEALNDESEDIRHEVVEALGEIGEALIDAGKPADAVVLGLIKALADESKDVRKNALEALAGVKPPSQAAVPALIKMLADESEDMRYEAVDALGGIGEVLVNSGQPADEVASNLIKALKDKSKDVRKNALEELGQMRASSQEAVE